MSKASYCSGLTSRQKEVLEFIKRKVAAGGFPPTRTEVAEHFGWKSPNAADDHIRALERKGAITITKGAARGITLTKAAGGLLAPENSQEAELRVWRKTFPDFCYEPATGRLTQPGLRFNPSDTPIQQE